MGGSSRPPAPQPLPGAAAGRRPRPAPPARAGAALGAAGTERGSAGTNQSSPLRTQLTARGQRCVNRRTKAPFSSRRTAQSPVQAAIPAGPGVRDPRPAEPPQGPARPRPVPESGQNPPAVPRGKRGRGPPAPGAGPAPPRPSICILPAQLARHWRRPPPSAPLIGAFPAGPLHAAVRGSPAAEKLSGSRRRPPRARRRHPPGQQPQQPAGLGSAPHRTAAASRPSRGRRWLSAASLRDGGSWPSVEPACGERCWPLCGKSPRGAGGAGGWGWVGAGGIRAGLTFRALGAWANPPLLWLGYTALL